MEVSSNYCARLASSDILRSAQPGSWRASLCSLEVTEKGVQLVWPQKVATNRGLPMHLVTSYEPPEKRRGKAVGGIEERLTEAAVMLALTLHILDRARGGTVSIHPDGEHAKRFDIPGELARAGFQKSERLGRTVSGGTYRRASDTIIVNPRSGVGDVVGEIEGRGIVVECKGGTINTKHSGQLSKLRQGLCEAVGLLMARVPDGAREVAAVPWTPETERLAARMASRCRDAGVEIALVHRDGSVQWVAAN